MRLFLLVFFSLYSGLHLYVFSRIRGLACLGTASSLGLSLALAFMVFSPILVFYLAREGSYGLARGLAFLSFLWMAFAFLFFFISLLLDALSLLLSAFGPHLGPRPLTLFSLILSTLCVLYGLFEAESIRVKSIEIRTNKVPLGKELTLLHITDLHLGITTRKSQVQKIFKAIEDKEVDLLVCSGDIVDGQMEEYVEFFSRLAPRLGKFAVTGNHEFYSGLGLSQEFFRRARFSLLSDEAVTAGDIVNIVGVHDEAALPYGSGKKDLEGLLRGVRRDLYTIVLRHRPTFEESCLGLFDLQLSGHTHRGQIFPFRFITVVFFPYCYGLFQLPKGSMLYVSSGAGTWGPPIRFLSPPEITIFRIRGSPGP
jgi:predicted MPP superfamily phosphohydrolase